MKPFGWRSAYASALSYAHHTSADVEKDSTLEDTMGWSANCQVVVPADTMPSMTSFGGRFKRLTFPAQKSPLGFCAVMANDMTVPHWSHGQQEIYHLGLDQCPYMCTNIHPSDVGDGRGAAELAAVRKQAKYSDLPSSHTFVPIAIESLGQINQSGFDFISEVGRRISAISGDPRERNQLFQRLSICTQQFNAMAFRGAFEDFSGNEAW